MTATNKPKPEWKRWHKITLGVIASLFVLVLAITTLSPESDTQTKASASNESSFDRPTEAERTKLLAGLYEIDPRMKADPDRYVSRAVDSCSVMLASSLDDTEDAQQIEARFKGGSMPNFDFAQARKTAKLIEDTFCG